MVINITMGMDKETEMWMKSTTRVMYISAIIALISLLGIVWFVTYSSYHAMPSIITLVYTFIVFGLLALLSRYIKKSVYSHVDKAEERKHD